jgi:integrase
VPVCDQLYDILAPHLAGRIGLAFGQTPAQPFGDNVVRERASGSGGMKGFEPADLGFHEARHTFSSLLAAPVSRRIDAIATSGHADSSMDDRLTHPLDPSYLDVAKALSEYLRRADTASRTGALTGASETELLQTS